MAFGRGCEEAISLDAMPSMARSEAEKHGMDNVRFEKGTAVELPGNLDHGREAGVHAEDVDSSKRSNANQNYAALITFGGF